jgi:phosphoribosylaminoimidazolecarboxamide formyltransferase/IMP cyclohydrolase
MSGRIAVGVSGSGSNLRALVAAARRGELPGDVVLVFADRSCAALDWATEQGIETALIAGGSDGALAAALADARPDVVALAGYMRVVGARVLSEFGGRILNVHPSLLPAFPGVHAVQDALAAGVRVTGVTVHLVDETLDDGPVVAQEAVSILPGDDEASLWDRLHVVEHRLLPRAVAASLAGALRVDGRHVTLDMGPAEGAIARHRRALLSVSDKTGLAELGRGLVERGFELVSTGGTARALWGAGLPVTDVEAVTGFPEMLGGRVKTLHPRIHAGLLADLRKPEHREALIAAGIVPFEVVVVSLYPFAEAARDPRIPYDDLVEEIDIGGPSMVRAAAKNHANVAIVTSPEQYASLLDALDEGDGIGDAFRAELAVAAFRHTAAYDARIAAELPARMGLTDEADPFPDHLTIALDKVETLRYGENPHQPAARYRRADRQPTPADGPFATGEPPLQGKALSYNNVLDASAAAGLARLLRGPAAVVVKHTNPSGVAERPTLVEALRAALAGDPVSVFGGVVALRGTVDADLARALTELFLEVIVAPAFEPAALDIFGSKPNLRLVVDPSLVEEGPRSVADPLGSIRSAGGAVLVTAPDVLPDDPAMWQIVSARQPTAAEGRDLDLAWRIVRAVTSNAIVLVRDGMEIGLGSGQTSRVDACVQAVAKARRSHGEDAARGAVAASDAFFPFPDGPQVLLDAGVSAIVQPGGSVRDADTLAAVDAAGAAMLLTGIRHFRH